MIRKRFLAFIIDCILIVSPCMLFTVLYIFFNNLILYTNFKKIIYILYLISILFCYVGLVGKDVITKRSIGKKCVGISIISLNGSEPTYFQVLIRNIFMLVWPLEVIMIVFDKPRLGDMIAKTKVERDK